MIKNNQVINTEMLGMVIHVINIIEIIPELLDFKPKEAKLDQGWFGDIGDSDNTIIRIKILED
jgi:hypothetical protein